MTRRNAARLVILALVALPLGGCSYNKFVGMDQAVQTQWAQVQNQLQRRNDLIPNLVESVKGYAAHEEGVFREIAESRSQTAGREDSRGDHSGCESANERAWAGCSRSRRIIRS